jgi:hypothetical protein
MPGIFSQDPSGAPATTRPGTLRNRAHVRSPTCSHGAGRTPSRRLGDVGALVRRAVVTLGLAGLVGLAAVSRRRGRRDGATHEGSWRELSGPDLR